VIGEKVVEVRELWKGLYNFPDSFRTDGSQWDKLFADGERFSIGSLRCEALPPRQGSAEGSKPGRLGWVLAAHLTS
jgi:hypothetical protein